MVNCKSIRTIAGGVLIHLSLGSLYTAANMITYIISYLRFVVGNKSITASNSGWLFAISIMGQAVSMMFAGKLETRVGSRWCTTIGCILFNICVVCSYWAVNNFYALLLVYGFLFGMSIGLAYSAPISMAIKWLPGKSGLATGIIVAGFGCGPLIFNQVQSLIINPKNISPAVDPTDPLNGRYFPADVVKNVPQLFLILAAIYAVMQLIGILIVAEPTNEEMSAMKAQTLPITGESHVRSTGFTPRELRPTIAPTPRGTHATTDAGIVVDHPYKPNESMKTIKFWEIWATFLFVGLTTTFMSSYWKVFGQSFITDDYFLVVVGSVSSVCNGLFRPLWGMAMDKFSYRNAMTFLCVVTAILIGTLSLTSHLHQAFFLIWVCLIYLCIGGFYAMFPAYTSLSFGNLYMVGNYGFIFTNQFFSAFLSAFFINMFIKKLGNTGITILLAIMLAVAGCISLFGKKWDYHVGRRELHPTTIPTITVPFKIPDHLTVMEASETEENEVVDAKVEAKNVTTVDMSVSDDKDEISIANEGSNETEKTL